MKTLYKLFAALIAAALFFGCDKPEVPVDIPEPEKPAPEKPAPEKIGAYIYDGDEYPVYSMAYAANSVSVVVRISPQQDDQDVTSYAVIGVNAALLGKTIDVEYAWNNDNYYFIYETPLKYYSQYRKLLSGSIYVKRAGASGDEFVVKADIVLPDGKDFKFEYEGKINEIQD